LGREALGQVYFPADRPTTTDSSTSPSIFAGDFFDDPTIQLTKFVSHDLSPINFSGATDRFLAALFVG
jgi:hypothetical protein